MNEDITKELLHLLLKRMDDIEKKLKEMSAQPIEYHITIHDLDIHDPSLEELTFNLDNLDIKELSGALNMGNNFGPKVEQKQKKKPEEEMPTEEKKTQHKEKKEEEVKDNIGGKNPDEESKKDLPAEEEKEPAQKEKDVPDIVVKICDSPQKSWFS